MAARGFQVVGIAVDFRDKVLAFADEMQIDYPLLIGEQEALDAAAAFGVEAVGCRSRSSSTARAGRDAALGELTAAEAAIILEAVRQVECRRVTARGRARAARGCPGRAAAASPADAD